jgi:peptidoglycan hydrolase-like protein with peptidoglycan-binding domain
LARKSTSRRAAARKVEAGDGAIARLADRAFENPAMSGGLVVMALTASAIVSNAMFLQAGRHPEPLFMTRPAAVPQVATPRPAVETPAGVPLPRSRAETPAAQPASAAVPESAAAATPDQVLVADVQRELARLGLYVDTIDGIAGSRTRTAISAYEASAGLPLTGEASTAVLGALRSPPAPIPAARAEEIAPVAAPPVEQAAVAPATVSDGASDIATAEQERATAEEQARYFRVQAALNLIGYGPINVDGEPGEHTSNAIRRFELDNGLPVTGKIDDRLIESLISIGAMQSM